MRAIDFLEIFISRAIVYCFRNGFLAILALTALIASGVRTDRGRPALFRSLMSPVSSNNLMHRYTNIRLMPSGFSVLKMFDLSILHLKSAITAIPFSLSGYKQIIFTVK